MTTAPDQTPLRVALLGGGVVGGSVARLLTAQADDGFLSVENDTVTVVARNAQLA